MPISEKMDTDLMGPAGFYLNPDKRVVNKSFYHLEFSQGVPSGEYSLNISLVPVFRLAAR
ncbi:MAG: hypothetical protein WC545_04130 [Patescibacteria group bacterium]